MKKVIYFLILMFLFFNFKGYDSNLIIGTWETSDTFKNSEKQRILFMKDSTFKQIIKLEHSFDQDTLMFNGLYQVNLDTLIMSYAKGTPLSKYKITKLSKNKLVLSNIYFNKEEVINFYFKRKSH